MLSYEKIKLECENLLDKEKFYRSFKSGICCDNIKFHIFFMRLVL